MKKVIWTENASTSLDEFCDYIRQDSISAAKKVRAEIIKAAALLSKNPEMYQLDEFFASETLNVRRFFKWSYKIVYQVLDKEVVILDVFHTSRGDEEE